MPVVKCRFVELSSCWQQAVEQRPARFCLVQGPAGPQRPACHPLLCYAPGHSEQRLRAVRATLWTRTGRANVNVPGGRFTSRVPGRNTSHPTHVFASLISGSLELIDIAAGHLLLGALSGWSAGRRYWEDLVFAVRMAPQPRILGSSQRPSSRPYLQPQPLLRFAFSDAVHPHAHHPAWEYKPPQCPQRHPPPSKAPSSPSRAATPTRPGATA